MVSTTERLTDNSPISPGSSVTVIKPMVRKSIRLFTEVLDVKKKTSVRRLGAGKSKHKEIISGSMLWSSIPNRKGHTKINEQVNKYIYSCILNNHQVVQSPIANDFLKVSIYGHSEPQLVSKTLLQVSVR